MQNISFQKIGIIGIGLVGYNIASNLIKSGFELYGVDIDIEQQRRFLKLGGQICTDPKVITHHVNVIFLALMTPKIIDNVLFDPQTGIANSAKEELIIINCSTIDPDSSLTYHSRLKDKNIKYLECPIAGGSVQIEDRTATYLVGGDLLLFLDISPILKKLSNNILYTGEISTALKSKLAINLVLGLNRAALAEGILFADILGLNREKILDIFQKTPAASFVANTKGSALINEDFTPRGYLFQHAKDVQLILAEAHKAGKFLPFSEFHNSLLQDAILHGDGNLDNIAIYKELKRRSNNSKKE